MRTALVLAALGTLVTLVACGEADPYGDMGTTTASAATESAQCSASMPGQDPATLTACTGTKTQSKGRCVTKSTLGTFGDTFEQAGCKSDEACLPEDLVKQGSKIELKKCDAVLGNEGRCFWPLAKDVIASYDILQKATKDQCEGDQICAPCVNPVTKQDTGVCSLGGSCSGGTSAKSTATASTGTCPQVEPILDATTFPQGSCGSNMLCVDPSLVGDRASLLASCDKGVCAPLKSVVRGGNYVPKTCKSLAGAEGRCSNVGVPDVAKQKDVLPQAECDADERCAPCFDPTTGKDTGACEQATCDKPAGPAVTFAACCGGQGKCVPTATAGDGADDLSKDSCTGDTPLCAPTAFLPGGTGTKCTAILGAIDGVCASKCALDLGFVGMFIQGTCTDDELCVPCSQAPAGTAACN